MLPVSLDCPFLISPSLFSSVYILNYIYILELSIVIYSQDIVYGSIYIVILIEIFFVRGHNNMYTTF
jgi:hypothetical protein